MKYKHKATGLIVESVQVNAREEVFFFAKGYNFQYQIPASIVEGGNDWEEVKKEPLLVTEDGVEIFEKQQVLYGVNIDSWVVASTKISDWGTPDGGKGYGWRFFSTKEKRLDYIVSNKPVLSYGEFLSASVYKLGAQEREAIERVTKGKLKANDSNL